MKYLERSMNPKGGLQKINPGEYSGKTELYNATLGIILPDSMEVFPEIKEKKKGLTHKLLV